METALRGHGVESISDPIGRINLRADPVQDGLGGRRNIERGDILAL